MKYYCNPINLEYHYQYSKRVSTEKENSEFNLYREAADPSVIFYKEKYLMFTSMTSGFYDSEDLVKWNFHRFPSDLPIYDYAPDVCVIGEYIYFSASKKETNCPFYRTKDPYKEPFEIIEGTFPFWDPNLFEDDNGKLYLYWGCSNITPIYGVELEKMTMKPLADPTILIDTDQEKNGFERNGEDYKPPKSEKAIDTIVQRIIEKNNDFFAGQITQKGINSEKEMEQNIRDFAGNNPYIEGAWMTKYAGKYYLQYAVPGTQYNVYCDAVYIGDSPLGPFSMAKNNPFSYKPGGFITGAGHGSTFKDKMNDYWHAATMRITLNDRFERRIGLWKAGVDKDGELFCDQRYGDWPVSVYSTPFDDPMWMLLSYKKRVEVSSGAKKECAVDEDIRTYWKAETNRTDEWIEIDLGKEMTVNAVQINFADDSERKIQLPDDAKTFYDQDFLRYLDQTVQSTKWLLEGSTDGKQYFVIQDNTKENSDLSHNFFASEDGIDARYVKLTISQVPYNGIPCISGLRVFGTSDGTSPEEVENIKVEILSNTDIQVCWDEGTNITGYNILWGHSPEKLYHSYMVMGNCKQAIGALSYDQKLFLRVDSFNEVGIAKGKVIEIR
ncbi:1,4-beta-xylanase [Leuconostoc mesenteroides P45]|uniref:family 43 glycosylhydrolase n=1 Tax=Leuconostoc mesenteroides TaxID=1245 RepID=UPI0004FF6C13|nr:family 43 glycosylhydrolase [Leuconostoc mesenteroides]KGB49672.1 1,4-beta-xylanase [Leuconostoc mesenteroides P45]